MVAYAKKYMKCFLTEKQIEEAIGKEFSVPTNVPIEKELDLYLRSILTEKKTKIVSLYGQSIPGDPEENRPSIRPTNDSFGLT